MPGAAPDARPRDALAGANALRSLTSRFAATLGSLLGGVLAAWWSPRAVLALDLATFVVSIVTLIGIRDAAAGAAAGRSLARDVAAGVRYVLRRRWISAVMAQGMAQVALVSAPVAICLPLVLGAERAWYGLALAVEAAGALAGASLAAARRFERRGLVGMLGLLCQGPQLIVLGVGGPALALVATSALAGAGAAVFAVLWTTALQHQVEPGHLGRVMAMDQLTATALSPVGLGVSGWLVVAIGVPGAAWFALAALLLSVLAVLPVEHVDTFGPDVGG